MAPLKPGPYIFTPDSISQVRSQLRLTQEQFANKLGISKTAITRWEKGTVKPDADSLAAIYSLAAASGINPEFFKPSNTKQGRSRLIVAWDFQNLAISEYEVPAKSESLKKELAKRFPSVSYNLYKTFASPLHSFATRELANHGWRVQEYSYDIDDELYTQSWSDCNQAPQDTIFVLITRDGDFVDFIEELKNKGVRVYLMAPEHSSQHLIETVGKKRWIPWNG